MFIFKISFPSNWPRWIPWSNFMSCIISRISSRTGRSVILEILMSRMGLVHELLIKRPYQDSTYTVLGLEPDFHMYCSNHGQERSSCLYCLVFNLMTSKLCDCVIPTYNEFSSWQQGGFSYQMDPGWNFLTSCDTIKTLKNFLNIFVSKGVIT